VRVRSRFLSAITTALVLIAGYGEASAGTSTVTVSWTGGFCEFCPGQGIHYTCNSEGNWNGGLMTFMDPVPGGSFVTKIDVAALMLCVVGNTTVSVQGTVVQTPNLNQECSCDSCPATTPFSSAVMPLGWPGYNYGGMNTIVFDVDPALTLCIDNAVITLTWDFLSPDADNDGLLNANDNCPAIANPGQENNDGDAQGDVCDLDDDNDGSDDAVDNCPFASNAGQKDVDGDMFGDACDTDDDSDGLSDGIEVWIGLNPVDIDTDEDTISDAEETGSPNAPSDTDGDGSTDGIDSDSDNDGLSDASEAGDADVLTDPVDTDKDGKPDFQDTDSDNDGALDGVDNCLLISNPDQGDADKDGIGDGCETDDDNDSIVDDSDNCPLVGNPNQADADMNGVGDACEGAGAGGAGAGGAGAGGAGGGDATTSSATGGGKGGGGKADSEGCGCVVVGSEDAPGVGLLAAMAAIAAYAGRRRRRSAGA
jgi:MYXO-CTERM domain-containing protein